MNKSQRLLIRRYLQFMEGFEESPLFQDYLDATDNFTEDDYADAICLLFNLTIEPRASALIIEGA